MQKYKMSFILYSSAIGVFYGVTTASAVPFRNWVQDFMVESTAVVTQFVSSRDFEFKSGARIATGPIAFDSGELDPIAAFISGIQQDFQTSYDSIDATSDRSERGLGAFTSDSGSQSVALPLNEARQLDARSDHPIRFEIDRRHFPNAKYPKIKKSKHDPDKIADKDPDTLSTPDFPVLYVSAPVVEELIANIPKDIEGFSPPGITLPGDDTPFSTTKPPIPIVSPSFGAVQTIPEAATLTLLGLGVAGLSFIRRRPARGEFSRS